MEAIPPSSAENSPARLLALSLFIGGLVTIGLAIVLGATVEPLLYLIALTAIIDFALAWFYATGRLGAPDQARRETELANKQAMAAEDPSYNPYARED